jgi:hypothetical protein
MKIPSLASSCPGGKSNQIPPTSQVHQPWYMLLMSLDWKKIRMSESELKKKFHRTLVSLSRSKRRETAYILMLHDPGSV